MKYKVKHIAEYAAIRLLSGFFMLLPTRVAQAIVWGPARLAYGLGRKKRRRTLRRLRQCLPTTYTDGDLEKIGWRAWRNLVFMAVESLRLPSTTPGWLRKHMRLDNIEEVQALLAQGRSAIVAVPHMGNWELAGIALRSFGVRLFTLVRRQKNPLMNDWMNKIRESTGVDAVDTQSRDITLIPKKLKEGGHVLAILPDVRAKRGGVDVRFLGGATTLPAGAAKYARDAGCPIFTAMVYRSAWTRHGWRKTGYIEPDYNRPEDEDIQRMMQYIADRFTESIHAQPDNYFWFNKRWVMNEE